jgi:hypothetical protein
VAGKDLELVIAEVRVSTPRPMKASSPLAGYST